MTYTDWWLIGLTVIGALQLIGCFLMVAAYISRWEETKKFRDEVDSLWRRLNNAGPW